MSPVNEQGSGRSDSAGRESEPMVTIISAVYNVDRYLSAFIASVEEQDCGLDRIEILMVDDGSTDDSLASLETWRRRHPDLVRVLTKENGGQSSARNLGLDHARGEWVTFIDPDDTIKADYLSRVLRAIRRHPDLALVATNRIIHVDETGAKLDRHPLRAMFAHRDQFKDLDEFPEFFHGSAPSAFFRRHEIEKHGLRFDPRIRPNFEDGHFCQRYLLRAATPVVAFMKSAEYYYRKRMDQSSTLQTGMTLTSRYLDVPRYGYLDLLQEASALKGRPPEWLQNMIIYELSHYISPEDAVWNRPTACHGSTAVAFVALMREIRRYLDDDVIRAFSARVLRPEWRQLLLYGLRDEAWHSPHLVIHAYDRHRKQVLMSFRFTGPEPEFSLIFRGRKTQPIASKVRSLVYWETALLRERLIWVSSEGSLRALLDGRFVEIRTNWTDHVPTVLRPLAMRRIFNIPAEPSRPRRRRLARPRRPRLSIPEMRKGALLRLAGSRLVQRYLANAWVLIDRVDDSGDSAENLFRYLRKRHRKINAWFVVQKGTPDFNRLKADGYRRIAGYGGVLHILLMLNCKHLISSHIDAPIVTPTMLAGLVGRPDWNFVFLQHGVIKDDLSGWLNRKRIDLFVTSTPDEYHSIAGDDNRYVFTTKQVKRTGLPRFDRLRELAQNVSPGETGRILVAPTWRDQLAAPLKPGQFKRDVIEDFESSEYALNWLGLLASPRLERACAAGNVRLAFLPHPNMQPILDRIKLPEHVEALTYTDNDAQQLFACAAMVVTDYSSTAFNAAYVDHPVVYFQFDAAEVERGSHRGRKGYFSYQEDGFGPVTYTTAEAEDAIIDSIGNSCAMREPYISRVAAAFPDRDGRCCERVTAAIRAL